MLLISIFPMMLGSEEMRKSSTSPTMTQSPYTYMPVTPGARTHPIEVRTLSNVTSHS